MPRCRQTDCKFPSEEKHGEVQENGNRHAHRAIVSIQHEQAGCDDERDPDQVVSPQTAAPQLLALEDKLRFIGDTGIDAVLVVPFDERLARMAPESFLETVLVDAVSPVAVHVGTDFRFGFMATGDVSTLRLEGARRGFDVVPHDLVTLDGEAVTSTRIRSCVARGALDQATRLLGRPTRVRGHVHHGRGEGDSLGFPTANVEPLAFSALPPAGGRSPPGASSPPAPAARRSCRR